MPAKIPAKWDREVDVVVLGSGGAGLVAATLAHDGGAETLLLEKAPLIGGTTGVSGGMPWVPRNKHMAAVGVEDSREDSLTYLRRLTLGIEPDSSLLEVYVDTAHEMIDYLEEHTPLRMFSTSWFADYYHQFPGGKQRGRSIENHPFDAKQLGEWAQRLRISPIYPPITMEEGSVASDPSQINFALLAERAQNDIRTMGGALVASLFKGLLDRGVEALTEAPARELVLDGDGAVVGVRAEREGGDLYVGARRGVILATGGYEWNKELVSTFLRQGLTHPLSPPYNDGDGLVMAMEAGAALGNMGQAWWSPAVVDPTMEFEGHPLAHTGSGIPTLPGAMLVNRSGKRFVNECTTYMDLPKTFYTFDPVAQEHPNYPSWAIFDDACKSTNIIFTMMPGEPAPDWLDRAPTIRELAEKVGIDPDGLDEQVSRFNRFAAEGVDPDFERGAKAYGPHTGGDYDASRTLSALETPPFYALPILWGALGTNGGPRTDENARVKNHRGGLIDGLFAAGNVAAGVFGPTYPGGGATLGPAMTFGYIAGKAAAARPSRDLPSGG